MVLLAGGWPPLILIPCVFPAAVACRSSAACVTTPAPPLARVFHSAKPAGTPGCLPSGDIETRAARLPVADDGRGGPGVAEKRNKGCGSSVSGRGLGRANFRCRFYFTGLRAGREAGSGSRVQFNLGRAGILGNMDGAISVSLWSSVGRFGSGRSGHSYLRSHEGAA